MDLYFSRDFVEAKKAFERSLEAFPDDMAAQRYVRNCEELIIKGASEDWNGVEVVLSK